MTFRFKKGCPLGFDYPFTRAKSNILPEGSPVVSVRHKDDPRVLVDIDKVPDPTHPEDGDIYWMELAQVATRVNLAKRGKRFDEVENEVEVGFKPKVLDPYKPFLSNLFRSRYNVTRLAEAGLVVRADFPTSLVTGLAEDFLRQGAKLNYDVLPRTRWKEFTDGPVLLGHIIGWAIHTVSPSAFATKWEKGRCRPEEAIHGWATGELEAPRYVDTILSSLVNKSEVANDARSFTLYPEGSPMHPSYVAMHAAVAAIVIILNVIFKLDTDQRDEAIRAQCNISIGRDIAGVHYLTDSLTGMDLGEKIIAEKLPVYLNQLVGADLAMARQYANEAKQNWLASEGLPVIG